MVCWIGYALAGYHMARAVAAGFGDALLRLGQGKFNDATVFVHCRLRETLWLATLGLLFIAAQRLFSHLIRGRFQRGRWALNGAAGFVFLNLWIGAAMNTALFWGAMGAGAGLENQMQFHLKRILSAENPIATRAVLVGSSQTRAEIDEDMLNQLLGTNLWTTELHFPGSHAYDLLLIERQLRRVNPRFVICYVSEGYFYAGSRGGTLPTFLSFRDLRDGLHRGAQHYLSNEEILSGLLGDVMPLFRCRGVVAQRVLGPATVELKQLQYDSSLQADLEARARQAARGFQINAESQFQKQAFEDFVARCQLADRRVILLTGGFNPILARQIQPAVRADMLRFLNELKNRHPLVTIVPETDLPEQTPADYSDLNHVNPEAQRRFTQRLANLLADFLAKEQRGD